jgi:hypothetical protein
MVSPSLSADRFAGSTHEILRMERIPEAVRASFKTEVRNVQAIPSEGARRIRTADLLGAIQGGR